MKRPEETMNNPEFTGLPFTTSRPLRIGLDCDDVLYECFSYAIERANRDFGTNLNVDEVKCWGYSEGDYEKVFPYFGRADFVATQPLIPGAREFIRDLSRMTGVDIYIITAVPIEVMGERGKSLRKNFPWIDEKHYILSSSKEVSRFDVFVDDAPHNLFANQSKYRIVRRHSWNENISGMLSYTDFAELKSLIVRILKHERPTLPEVPGKPFVVALIGPTGAEKNKVASILCENGFERPRSYTTKENANPEFYTIIPDEEFRRKRDSGELAETSVYGTNKFGLAFGDVQKILDEGKNVVTVMDMCGAASLSSKYPTVVIYKDKPYHDILKSIIECEDEVEEKVSRIMSLQSEQSNADLCDYKLDPTESAEICAARVLNLVREK